MKSTDFLFATPKLSVGVGRTLDLGSTLNTYNSSSSEEEADYKAMYSDWYMVASDLKKAMVKYDREQRTSCY